MSVSTMKAYHVLYLCQQWQHIMFFVYVSTMTAYHALCQQWQHIMLCVNGDSISCSMSLCQQWQHIMFYAFVNNDSIWWSVSVSTVSMTAYHVLCLCVKNDSISCFMSLCQEWQHIMFCVSVSRITAYHALCLCVNTHIIWNNFSVPFLWKSWPKQGFHSFTVLYHFRPGLQLSEECWWYGVMNWFWRTSDSEIYTLDQGSWFCLPWHIFLSKQLTASSFFACLTGSFILQFPGTGVSLWKWARYPPKFLLKQSDWLNFSWHWRRWHSSTTAPDSTSAFCAWMAPSTR